MLLFTTMFTVTVHPKKNSGHYCSWKSEAQSRGFLTKCVRVLCFLHFLWLFTFVSCKYIEFLKYLDKNLEFLELSWILSWQILKLLGKIFGFLEFLNKSFQILKFLQNPSSYFLNKVAANSCFLLRLEFLSLTVWSEVEKKRKKELLWKQKRKQEVGPLLDWNKKANLIWETKLTYDCKQIPVLT